jgi:pyruvate/2-oxoglutarate dehydrogenase complex dihydrolipoamide acyltransferase (E2) component
MEEEDAHAQEEEREVLRAIYGEDAVRWDPAQRVLTIVIGGDEEDEPALFKSGGGSIKGGGGRRATAATRTTTALELRILLAEDYPSKSPPVVELGLQQSAAEDDDDARPAVTTGDLLRRADDACAEACCGGGEAAGTTTTTTTTPGWSPGEVALFSLCERVREIRREWLERELQEARRRREEEEEQEEAAAAEAAAAAAAAAAADAQAAAAADAPAATRHQLEDGCDPADVDRMAKLIVSGDPVVERKSTFQAHVARVGSVADVKAAVAALLRVPKIRNCTHNIMAYRIRREVAVSAAAAGPGSFSSNPNTTTTTFLADADDDGEDAAGGRLLQLLHNAGAENVVVVVSRWFGGVLLGPSRFALINNTARSLLVREGYIVAAAK